MKFDYRKLSLKEIPLLIKMRISQLTEDGSDVIDISSRLEEYYSLNIKNGTFISWVAFADEKMVATCGLSFINVPPAFDNPDGKMGMVSSVFTLKEFRRQGIAKKLISLGSEEAKTFGCKYIFVNASDMGIPFYKNFGFKEEENFIKLNFQ